MIRILFLSLGLTAVPPAMAEERDPKAATPSTGANMARVMLPATPPVRATLSPEAMRTHIGLNNPITHRSSEPAMRTRTRANWVSVVTPTAVTSDAGASYAVRDTLGNYRKLQFRKSALGALLVLKIDGNADSAPISVGGGGVAAVMWKARPR